MIRYPSKNEMSVGFKEKNYPPTNDRNGSKLSNYGYNLMKVQPDSSNLRVDQRVVFEKQQHNFDIINYRPTTYRARLKMYPRLTLQDKIN